MRGREGEKRGGGEEGAGGGRGRKRGGRGRQENFARAKRAPLKKGGGRHGGGRGEVKGGRGRSLPPVRPLMHNAMTCNIVAIL